MKTCSVTSLTDLEMFDGFEWGSYVGVLIVYGVFYFSVALGPILYCVFIFILRLLAYFHFPLYFSSVFLLLRGLYSFWVCGLLLYYLFMPIFIPSSALSFYILNLLFQKFGSFSHFLYFAYSFA